MMKKRKLCYERNSNEIRSFINKIDNDNLIVTFQGWLSRGVSWYSMEFDSFPNLEYQVAKINYEKIINNKSLPQNAKKKKSDYAKTIKQYQKDPNIHKEPWVQQLKNEGFF